jgi:hypothetical protein
MPFFIDILFNTRQIFEQLSLENNRIKTLAPFAIFSISWTMSVLWAGEYELGMRIFLFILGVPLFFFLIGYIPPLFYLGICKVFGGKATFKEIQLVFSMVFIPETFLVLSQLLIFTITGTPEFPEANPLIYFFAQLFAFKILIVGIGYFNQTTYHNAFVYSLAAGIILTLLFEWVR